VHSISDEEETKLPFLSQFPPYKGSGVLVCVLKFLCFGMPGLNWADTSPGTLALAQSPLLESHDDDLKIMP